MFVAASYYKATSVATAEDNVVRMATLARDLNPHFNFQSAAPDALAS
jgi:hypothetical protein